MSTTGLVPIVHGQQPEAGDAFSFDFDTLTDRMRQLAATDHVPLRFMLPDAIAGLDYDAYRLIQFRPEQALWSETGPGYHVHAFHLGWLYPEPVTLFEVASGEAKPVAFGPDQFRYNDPDLASAIDAETFPGIAGFRMNYPLNQPEAMDELISFLGASYFRALGRDNIYGLSARGIVLNSWVDVPEEFPRFSEFYLQRPEGDGPATVWAAMESPSLTGAFQFDIHPAGPDRQETIVEVTARLFFREDIRELGVAPLTSMFLFADSNRSEFDDYRPRVHDSNGLLVERESGEILWRALNNTPVLGNSYLWENNPRAFGLYQRGRDFDEYQDAGAHYERRPSGRVEPQGEWGQGTVRLVEIPARLEADDNIVAFWVPAEPALAGEEREYRYRLVWGNLDPAEDAEYAPVIATRAGQGGVSGVENSASLRKFVVDFAGSALDQLPDGAAPDVLSVVSGGEVRTSTLSRLDQANAWRLVLDVETDGTSPLELRAYLVGRGRQLTETWLYQWRPAA
jgi:glucans biosynthesis protein